METGGGRVSEVLSLSLFVLSMTINPYPCDVERRRRVPAAVVDPFINAAAAELRRGKKKMRGSTISGPWGVGANTYTSDSTQSWTSVKPGWSLSIL